MRGLKTYAWVVGFEQSDLDAFILKVTLRLSQVEGCVVRRRMPAIVSECSYLARHRHACQFVKKVILSVDMVDQVELQ